MKRLRRVFLLFVVLALAGVVWSVKWSEPRYHLQPISFWLAKYGDGPANYKPSPQADRALQQMGEKAVPYLLKLLYSTNSHTYVTYVGKGKQRGMAPVLELRGLGVGGRVKAASINLRTRIQRVTVPASWDHWKAYLAFQKLGSAGRSAIPELVRLAQVSEAVSSPSGTGVAPPISFWKNSENVSTFAAQSPTYLVNGSHIIPVGVVFRDGGLRAPQFLSDGEIAVWSLAAIGKESVPPLMQLLTNSNPQIRCRAAMALGMMGEAAEAAVPALITTLQDEDQNTRREAADALGWIGQRIDLTIPALIQAFNDRDVESAAVESLGILGKRATNAIPALLALFETEYNLRNQTRGQYAIDWIALALNRISPETTRKEVMPKLISRIRNAQSPWTQSMTMNTIAQMTNQPDLVIPVLLETLDSTDNYTRNSTVHQLGGFGPAATSAIPKLISFSTSKDTNLCRISTNALDKIKPGWRNDHSLTN